MEADQFRDFAMRYTAAWCSQDPARVAAFFSPEGSLRVNSAAPAVGRLSIMDVARGFMTAFPDMVLTMDDAMIDGEHAVYHWTLTGTNTGSGGTGRRVRISGFEEWEFDTGGLVVASQGHYDEADYERQLRDGFEEPQP